MSIIHCITEKFYSVYILKSIIELLESSGETIIVKIQTWVCYLCWKALNDCSLPKEPIMRTSLSIPSHPFFQSPTPYFYTQSKLWSWRNTWRAWKSLFSSIFFILLPLLSMSSTRHHRNEKNLTFRNHIAAEVRILNLLLTSVLLNFSDSPLPS